MIRKYHNHKLQTSPRPHNNHETPGRQSSSLFPIEMSAKLEWTQSNAQHRTITESHNGSNNQQQINNNRTTALEQTAAKATWY